jgi:CRP-like cAMP-binding protein
MKLQDLQSPLKIFLDKYQLTEGEIDTISSTLKPTLVRKGEFFLQKGKMCDKLGILISGLLYAYYETGNGEEKVSRFFYLGKNSVVTSFESFRFLKKSAESIRAIEDSFLLCISQTDLDELYQQIPSLNRIGRELAELSYIQALERIHDLQALDKEKMFNKFYKEHRELFGRVKIQHLTSYLAMNRNLYSKFLKKID